ncbi:hypothetical protein D9M72_583140 [compost metagenome]
MSAPLASLTPVFVAPVPAVTRESSSIDCNAGVFWPLSSRRRELLGISRNWKPVNMNNGAAIPSAPANEGADSGLWMDWSDVMSLRTTFE